MVPTRDHDQIRQWAEQHGAMPAQVFRLKFDGEPAVLTFVFGEALEARPEIVPIDWETFFVQFDMLGLSMAFDEETPHFSLIRVSAAPQSPIVH